LYAFNVQLIIRDCPGYFHVLASEFLHLVLVFNGNDGLIFVAHKHRRLSALNASLSAVSALRVSTFCAALLICDPAGHAIRSKRGNRKETQHAHCSSNSFHSILSLGMSTLGPVSYRRNWRAKVTPRRRQIQCESVF